MGDDIETGSDYWAELVEQKSKHMAIEDRPEPMSSLINNPA